ncbi:LeuA family protein [Dactylosporangium sp. CA-092794]|uniref:LeuA family protein n=1 Tax=Dactylosporangium sp. CA-092794 TaxID=3239929 RepID=UPI003D8C783B
MTAPSRPELIHTSPLNFAPEVIRGERIRPRLTITDCTLREGQQAAEVAFSPDEEVALVQALHAIGVPVVQVGYAGDDDESVRRIRAACPDQSLASLLVGWKPDAADALHSTREAGADVCSVLFRSTDAHLDKLGHTRATAVERVQELVALARSAGFREVAFGPSFSTLADQDYLFTMYAAALEAGATVISLADSTGTAKPSVVRHVVERMRGLSDTAGVRVHMHNDLGLAMANTLAGIEAGADWIEVTVNGLGERAGNCALEELVVALEALYGIRLPIRSEGLYDVSRLVARMTGVPIPPMKPVVGADVFANKLEIHVVAARADPTLMEPFDPVLAGNRRTIRLGRGTGPTGVRMKADELGLDLPDDVVPAVVRAVNEWAVAHKRAVPDDAFAELVSGDGGRRG